MFRKEWDRPPSDASYETESSERDPDYDPDDDSGGPDTSSGSEAPDSDDSELLPGELDSLSDAWA